MPIYQELRKTKRSIIVIVILGAIAFFLVRYDIRKNRRFEMASREHKRKKKKLEELESERKSVLSPLQT